MVAICPKITEYEILIKAALLIWTSGVANRTIKYGILNGSDAWKKLYHKYVFLAEDLQNIFIQELMALNSISENDIDTLFNEKEKIKDLYAKAKSIDDLSDRWIRAIILKKIYPTK